MRKCAYDDCEEGHPVVKTDSEDNELEETTCNTCRAFRGFDPIAYPAFDPDQNWADQCATLAQIAILDNPEDREVQLHKLSGSIVAMRKWLLSGGATPRAWAAMRSNEGK